MIQQQQQINVNKRGKSNLGNLACIENLENCRMNEFFKEKEIGL